MGRNGICGGDAGGAKVTIPAPLDRLPLLARRGSAIPLLRPTIDSMSPTTAAPDVVDSFATDPGLLWWRVFQTVGSPGFTLYDGAFIWPDAAGFMVSSGRCS